MKTLLLLRHAKSSWKNPDLADHDRPLNKRGKADAPLIGGLLLKHGLVPDTIISSTAKRARKTAVKAAKACRCKGELQLTQDLYFTHPESWYAILQTVSNNNDCVMIVGHNPGLENFLEMVTGCTEALPTASLTQIELPINSWSDFTPDTTGRLTAMWRPREVEATS